MELNYFCFMNIANRQRQEDSMVVDKKIIQENYFSEFGTISDKNALFAVCDGMGGHKGGNIASLWVSKKLQKLKRLKQINKWNLKKFFYNIQKKSEKKTSNFPHNSATTVAGVLFRQGNVYSFNIGDSKVYKYYNKKLIEYSHDHSLVQEMIDNNFISKDKAFKHPMKNIVKLGIGIVFEDIWSKKDTPKKIFYKKGSFRKGDIFMLCSDGVTDILEENDLKSLLNEIKEDFSKSIKIWERAKNIPPDDNFSYILIKIR